MPMKSKAQRSFLWATNPELAAEFESKTPSHVRLPEHAVGGMTHAMGEGNAHEFRGTRGDGLTSRHAHGSYNSQYEPHGCSYTPSPKSKSSGYTARADEVSRQGRRMAGAGYDLTGMEHIQESPILGRNPREMSVLASHKGIEQRGSDYSHPNERGFRFRARHDGV